MEKENTKKFELNIKTLENFEQIMSTKLDEIEELKVTGLDKSSKLINIISLCANVKTLILEGDQRLNCDRVLTNIFKPENVENLIFNNVKLPKVTSLKRYTNLKMISLNGIRFCNVKEFLLGITEPQKLEILDVSNTDISNNSINVLQEFCNVKYLSLDNISNGRLDDFSFLVNNKNLLKISIINNSINITQIDNLIKCRCAKQIDAEIMDENNKKIENFKFEINETGSKIILPISQLQIAQKYINLYRISNIEAIVDEEMENNYNIKMLKKFKADVSIIVNDFSLLTVSQINKIKEILKIDKIQIVEDGSLKEYGIDEYIEARKDVEDIINNVSKHVSEPEKFLEIYRFLGQEFIVKDDGNIEFDKQLYEKYEVAGILQKCLQALNIESNIISGEELEYENNHSWNQVKLDGKWYNVDLGLDIQNIKKNKTEYCLLGDKTFLETHTPKSGKNNYCEKDFNLKLVNVFFKTGLFKDKLLQSYIEVIIEKVKKIFNFNKKQDVMALPEANIIKKEEN